MNCQEVQLNLSLYLYGELDFAAEEELELHLAECSLCQLALSREKSWHTTLNAEQQDAPLELLSQCRRDLRLAVDADSSRLRQEQGSFGADSFKARLRSWFDFWPSAYRWSPRLAFASFFVFLGFSLSRWTDIFPNLSSWAGGNVITAGLAPSFSRIRTIQPGDNNSVRIILDQVQEREIVGSISDAKIRELLLRGSQDPADPGLRVDAVELLKDQDGADIRDGLLTRVMRDENAAVRLKALEGLRRFRGDRQTHEVLLRVLEEDGNPAVRSKAIDVLLPEESTGPLGSDLALALQGIVQSEPNDDYLHARCRQILLSASPHSGPY